MTYKLIEYEKLKAFSEGLKSKYATKNDLPKNLADLQDDENHKLISNKDKELLQKSLKGISIGVKAGEPDLFFNVGRNDLTTSSTKIPLAENNRHGLLSSIDKKKIDAIPPNPKYTDTIQDLSGYVTKDALTNYKLEDGTIKKYNAIIDRNKNMNSHDTETCIVNMKINNESTREYLVKTYKTKYFTAQVAYSLVTPFKIYKRKGLGDQWEDWEELQVSQSFDNFTQFFNKELQKCATKSELPTKLSQLDNDKTFKTETEIQSMIEKASSLKKEVVTSLPTTGKDDVIYLVKDDKGKDNNNYLEYLWLNGKYELIGSTQVDLSGYAKQEDILASKIIDKYVLTKDFRTALNNDQDFLQAIKRDMFTLVIFDGSASDELVEQAGFESILYYKGQTIGICLIPTGDVISPDFVKQNQFKPNETYITSDLMKDYNQVIQEQFVELQSSLKQYVKNCLNRKLNVADIREFTQQELEEAFR